MLLQVEEILSGAHSQGVDANVVAEAGVLAAYQAATGQTAAGGAAAGSSINARKPIQGDCPICCDELEVGGVRGREGTRYQGARDAACGLPAGIRGPSLGVVLLCEGWN